MFHSLVGVAIASPSNVDSVTASDVDHEESFVSLVPDSLNVSGIPKVAMAVT